MFSVVMSEDQVGCMEQFNTRSGFQINSPQGNEKHAMRPLARQLQAGAAGRSSADGGGADRGAAAGSGPSGGGPSGGGPAPARKTSRNMKKQQVFGSENFIRRTRLLGDVNGRCSYRQTGGSDSQATGGAADGGGASCDTTPETVQLMLDLLEHSRLAWYHDHPKHPKHPEHPDPTIQRLEEIIGELCDLEEIVVTQNFLNRVG